MPWQAGSLHRQAHHAGRLGQESSSKQVRYAGSLRERTDNPMQVVSLRKQARARAGRLTQANSMQTVSMHRKVRRADRLGVAQAVSPHGQARCTGRPTQPGSLDKQGSKSLHRQAVTQAGSAQEGSRKQAQVDSRRQLHCAGSMRARAGRFSLCAGSLAVQEGSPHGRLGRAGSLL